VSEITTIQVPDQVARTEDDRLTVLLHPLPREYRRHPRDAASATTIATFR
jgi:hypothetical protein